VTENLAFRPMVALCRSWPIFVSDREFLPAKKFLIFVEKKRFVTKKKDPKSLVGKRIFASVTSLFVALYLEKKG